MKYKEKFRWIESVGVELEGGIDEEALKDFEAEAVRRGLHFSVGGDGSVYVEGEGDTWIPDVEIRFHSDDIDELLHYVKYLFEELGFMQNSTCGNHHHFKFTSQLAFSALSKPAVYKLFERKYREFAEERGVKYVKRIRGSYCRIPCDEKELYFSLFAINRYFALNFCSLFKHGTFEVRILPYADDYEEFKEMHLWLCKTVNSLISYAMKNLSYTISW